MVTNLPKQSLDAEGFTLIELLIAMAVSLVALSAIFATFQVQHRSYLKQEDVAELQQNLRVGMYFMQREIRMAGCDPTGNAGAGIVAADSTTFRFTEDVDGDGDIDADEDISYAVDGTQLKRTRQTALSSQAEVKAENITGLTFTYFDSNGAILAEPIDFDEVRAVGIELEAESPGNGAISPSARVLSARINCRNFGI